MSRRQHRARAIRRHRASTISALTTGATVAAAATLLSGAASAAGTTHPTVTVTSLNDTSSPAPSNVVDRRAPTLADAIAYINATSAGGTITFASALSGPLDLNYALPTIEQPVEIRGPGAADLVIRDHATSADPVLHFAAGDTTYSRISGLALSGGHLGGIYAVSPLVIRDVTISGATSTGDGGGIFADAAPLKILDSRISDNTGALGGGGIAFFGDDRLTVEGSTIAGNDTPGGVGGGIKAYGGGRTVIERSTISGNAAQTVAGVAITGASPTRGGHAYIENSTIADNTSGNSAGGVYVGDADDGGLAKLTLVGSTIARNVAISGPGGGIEDYHAALKLDDTIVARNTDTATGSLNSPDIFIYGGSGTPATVTARFSLVGDASDLGLGSLSRDSTDLTGSGAKPLNPELGALKHNGGATRTLLPKPGSPVLRRGDTAAFRHAVPGLTFNVDQRDRARAGLGSKRVSDGTDIGAVELTKVLVTKAFTRGDQRFSITTAAPATPLKTTEKLPVTLRTVRLAHRHPTVQFKRLVLTISGSRATHAYRHPDTSTKLTLSGLHRGRHTLTATITYRATAHGHSALQAKTLRLKLTLD